MRTIYYGSLPMNILFYLFDYGDIKRCLFISIFTEYSEQVVWRAIRKLLQTGLIEEYSSKPVGESKSVRYLTLSQSGKKTVLEMKSEHEDKLPSQNGFAEELQNIRGQKRKELVLRSYSTLRSQGILVDDNDKPPLSLLLSPTPAPISKDDEEDIRNMQDMGAYYSMTEVRAVASVIYGEGPLNQTRCVGILIRGYKLYFLYNMESKLIYFNTSLEKRTTQTILLYFDKSYLSRSLFKSHGLMKGPCILFGETYGCIPKLMYGRKKGQMELDEYGEIVDYGNWEMDKNWLTMRKLADIFSQTYFISLRHPGDFISIITNTPEELFPKATKNWVSAHPDMRLSQDGTISQAIFRESRERIFIWLDNSLSSLYSLFRSNIPIHVVLTESGAEEAISRILGERLLSIRTTDDEILTPSRYSNTGHKLI